MVSFIVVVMHQNVKVYCVPIEVLLGQGRGFIKKVIEDRTHRVISHSVRAITSKEHKIFRIYTNYSNVDSIEINNRMVNSVNDVIVVASRKVIL